MKTSDLTTPVLIADSKILDANISIMATKRPGRALRPHVKAFKSTAMAKKLVEAGHETFCCATIRELEGMVKAGLGNDLLLANETLDARRVGDLLATEKCRITIAVDSLETIAAAVSAGVKEVLIDVNVGLQRCGCSPDEAGFLSEKAKASGLQVRGVMGYEGHLMHDPDIHRRTEKTQESMEQLIFAHENVGGDIISGGGTGTWECNQTVTELQAGSYVLMDGDYSKLDLPFKEGLLLLTTVISTSKSGYAVLDGGLKALSVDSGNPQLLGEGEVMFCSDEHTTITNGSWSVGQKVGLRPSHIDPTISKHESIYLVEEIEESLDAELIETLEIDLRGW
ncbi:MAG: alanine racemase [Acidimicrobiales bacterium]|jgi:D-serine deaminase-like pyridoxal phosphate-dependent protein|nr:metal-activated pyridoxal enzyme [Acidimicrobiaceae bacterium]MDP6161319.1 alanine racemase [Acidimicrobiales bacterium]MDP6285889.1 alanine racemase [Acidimicrobiales bacterium]HJL91207.1 alanine racemase [Acidimicrobiales bacterium]HJO41289.1 alanine racemase [Acidimicrobiales bacterium]|tara:strand:+ start:9291 stop:10307 length:1017 start_codon:yes stop_codon:yes gene_type:complete